MSWDILTGVVLGGLFGWAAFAGVFVELHRVHEEGVRRTVPAQFWRLSAYAVLASSLVGGIAAWFMNR